MDDNVQEPVSLSLLRTWGDTLERAICAMAHDYSDQSHYLQNLLYPYASIWSKHVLPRRNRYDLSCLDDKHATWLPFASSHYSVLIKIYQSYRHLRQIIGCATEAERGVLSAEILLMAHEAISGYWEHLGSAIDSLGQSFDSAPCLNFESGWGLKHLQTTYASLCHAYNRRTQLIHYSIVPIGFDDGAIVFNERHFDEIRTQWTTARYTPEFVDTYYTRQWPVITSDLFSAWQSLINMMEPRDSNRPDVPTELLDSECYIHDGRFPLSGYKLTGIVQSTSTRRPKGQLANLPYWERGNAPSPSGTKFPPLPFQGHGGYDGGID